MSLCINRFKFFEALLCNFKADFLDLNNQRRFPIELTLDFPETSSHFSYICLGGHSVVIIFALL